MDNPIEHPGLHINQDVNGASLSEHGGNIAHRVGQVVSGVFLALELNPITNEGARLAALGMATPMFESSYATAGVFAGATFAIEAAGAVATAYLLDSALGSRAVGKMNRLVDKAGVTKFLRTNAASEGAIAMLAGSPAATVVKHRQDPRRTKQQNIRYGLTTATGVSVVSYPLGYAIAEGVSHPSFETIGLGGLLLGGIYGAAKYLRNKFSKENDEEAQKGNNSREEIL